MDMVFDQLNLNELRVFYQVFQNRSMTLAAKHLHLTQSGVSQHILSLERALEVKLFDRMQKKLFPTPAGRELFLTCQQSFENLRATLLNIKGGEDTLVGNLRIGVPQEFGVSILAPLLGQFAKQHEQLKLQINFEYSQNLLQELLRGDLDVAFVDGFVRHPLLKNQSLYTEYLDLCVSKKLMKKWGVTQDTLADIQRLPFIDYEADHPLVERWFLHQFQERPHKLHFRAFMPDPRGVGKMVREGLGCGILPHHISEDLKKTKDIHVFCSSKKALENQIGIATLSGRTLSKAVTEMLTFIRAQIPKI